MLGFTGNGFGPGIVGQIYKNIRPVKEKASGNIRKRIFKTYRCSEIYIFPIFILYGKEDIRFSDGPPFRVKSQYILEKD